MREEREEREGYRTAGPPSCEEKIRNTREIFISFSVFFCLRVCAHVDGGADKKAATGAGSDFNPAFVSCFFTCGFT